MPDYLTGHQGLYGHQSLEVALSCVHRVHVPLSRTSVQGLRQGCQGTVPRTLAWARRSENANVSALSGIQHSWVVGET